MAISAAMVSGASFSLPNSTHRTNIMGRTGSGKTQAGVWLLSEQAIESRPWVVIDYKGDKLINSIPYAQETDGKNVPSKPGVHIYHARPDRNDAVENLLRQIWEKGRAGVFVDEAYMMPDKGAYQGILTQGRSKNIPMINCTQQPAWIPRHVFSESDYHMCFRLTDKRDQKRCNEFMPVNFERKLDKYWSHYYSVSDEALFTLKPVPDADTLLETFAQRLAPKRRMV